MSKLQFLIFILSLILSNGYSQKNSELLNCWIKSYEPDFQFMEELDKLEVTLIEKQQIIGTSAEDYMKLISDIGIGKSTLNFDSLSVNQFVSEKPFKECTSISSLPNEDDRTLKYGLLFSIYVVLAREHATIDVELTNDSKLIFSNAKSELSEFETLLSKSMDQLEKKGIPRDEITISLKVADNVKMGTVADIQIQLKELNARKILYSN